MPPRRVTRNNPEGSDEHAKSHRQRSRCRIEELPGTTRRGLTSMRSLIARGTKKELRDELLFYFIISNATIWDFAQF
ncbi:hypothetical protein LINGRAHAP2_LOCUS23389 [Linum grandiflorum]